MPLFQLFRCKTKTDRDSVLSRLSALEAVYIPITLSSLRLGSFISDIILFCELMWFGVYETH